MTCATKLANQSTADMNEIQALWAEINAARSKFPSPELLMTALTEEVGELAKAFLDEPMANVRKEALQVACVAMRIYREGDPTFSDFRKRKGLDAQGD